LLRSVSTAYRKLVAANPQVSRS